MGTPTPGEDVPHTCRSDRPRCGCVRCHTLLAAAALPERRVCRDPALLDRDCPVARPPPREPNRFAGTWRTFRSIHLGRSSGRTPVGTYFDVNHGTIHHP